MSTNSPYIDYICIIIVDVATLPFAADSERPQSAVRDVLVQPMVSRHDALQVRGAPEEEKKRRQAPKVGKTLACAT
jgi:hypothetical protein